ncbi:hypothetical protein ACNKHW_17370 [Shigella flexneri]
MAHLDTYAPRAMLTPMPILAVDVRMDHNAAGLGVMLDLAERLKIRLPSMVFDLWRPAAKRKRNLGAQNLLKRMSHTEKKNTLLVMDL